MQKRTGYFVKFNISLGYSQFMVNKSSKGPAQLVGGKINKNLQRVFLMYVIKIVPFGKAY